MANETFIKAKLKMARRANTEQRTQARNKLKGLPPDQTSTRIGKKLTEQGNINKTTSYSSSEERTRKPVVVDSKLGKI